MESLQQENYSLSRQLQLSEECSKSLAYEMTTEISVLKQSLAKQNKKSQLPLWDMDTTPREKDLMNQVQRLNMILENTEKSSKFQISKDRTGPGGICETDPFC